MVFLVGVQADELIRKDATAGERGSSSACAPPRT